MQNEVKLRLRLVHNRHQVEETVLNEKQVGSRQK